MTFPASVDTVTLTVGPLYDAGGLPRRGVPLTARLPRLVKITEGGAALPTVTTDRTDETGVASLTLVATDSAGVDSTGWRYRVTCPGVIDSPGVDVELLAAEATVHVEDLVDGETSTGDQVYYLGATAGAVLAHGLVDGVPSITVARSPWRLDGAAAHYDTSATPVGDPAWPVIGADGSISLTTLEA